VLLLEFSTGKNGASDAHPNFPRGLPSDENSDEKTEVFDETIIVVSDFEHFE